MLLTLVEHPDPRLTSQCTDVSVFDAVLDKLVDSMIDVMYTKAGVGLAAPQVGVLQRLVIIDPSGGDEANQLVALINPSVTWRSVEKETDAEGCLSMPGTILQVPRSVAVDVEYHDVKGLRQIMRCTGFKARIVQHEVDHLDGIMMFDRASNLARMIAKRSLGKIR
jgi:peptide deformylase